ncbi:unnamed protein product, partial [Ectocarpus sp. 8 AP-2014]
FPEFPPGCRCCCRCCCRRRYPPPCALQGTPSAQSPTRASSISRCKTADTCTNLSATYAVFPAGHRANPMCACTHIFPRQHTNAASSLPGYRRHHHRPPPPPPPHRPTLQRHIHHRCYLLFVSHANGTYCLSGACVFHIKGPGDFMTKNHPVAPMRGYSPRAGQAINHDNQIKQRKPPPPTRKRLPTREAEQLLPWSANL